MGVTQYTQMIDNNGEIQYIEQDRVNRFLGEGWTLFGEQPKPEKKVTKSKSKNKITADAQVTSKASDKEEAWDPNEEDWADSEESMSAPEGERISDFEDDFQTAKKEN